MGYDLRDTIVAVASAPGGAGRGVVRISGPEALASLSRCFVADDESALGDGGVTARRVVGSLRVSLTERDGPLVLPGAVLLWPSERSFTRQPAAEFHTAGSPPLLAAVVDELCRCGARPEAPG
jgi:tRNA modification GTPase